MRRILQKGEWYEPISSHSILEQDYEKSIQRYAPDLFPGYICLRFNPLVESDYGNVKADMVLIDWDYRGWVIVEAELEHHSLSQHVEPQMRKLVNGRYQEAHAFAIHEQDRSLDLNRLITLVRNVDPEFLVIVPVEDPEWRTTLANLGVKIAVVEIYVNRQGQRIVAFAGDRPQERPAEFVTGLSRHSVITPRAFRLLSPSALPLESNVSLMFGGSLTTWRLIQTQREVFIFPNGSFDLVDGLNYKIVRDNQGKLVLEEEK